MTRVDFYILPDTDPEPRLTFACRLAEKAYKLGHRVYLHSADAAQAQALDDLLWRFQPSSFVPHALLAPDQDGGEAPVAIGWGSHPAGGRDVLINLAGQVPAFFEQFERVTEIVVQTPEVLQATRAAWRHYQERGCAPERRDLRG